jgi:hypothetical protein
LRVAPVVLAVLLGVLAAPSPSHAANRCPSLKMIVATGSGEHSGFGHVLGSVVSRVYEKNTRNANAERLEYPAISVLSTQLPQYNWSVQTGVNELSHVIAGFLGGPCRATPVFLLGYSQGAQVVGDTYIDHLSRAQQALIDGVFLFGDPKFWGGQNAPVAVGTYDASHNGIGTAVFEGHPRHIWPSQDQDKVRSYCLAADPICSFTLGAGIGCGLSCSHTEYAATMLTPFTTYTDHAAKFIIARWAGYTPPSAPSPGAPAAQAEKPLTPVPAGTWAETAGGSARTWTNFQTGGGTQGPSILVGQSVGVSCRTQGLRVANGNPWWYRVASGPWNDGYYVSADAFYNNGATFGGLAGTPFVDSNVPLCNGSGPPAAAPAPPASSAPAYAETTGGVAHTWTNYQNAGGTQGPSIAANQTVQIRCKVTGFRVADGNTWWYRIASGPWNDGYYVSADAFYNNGQTSGGLAGTPFVDPRVPDCSATPAPAPPAPSQPTYPETAGGVANTWTDYQNAGGTHGPSIAAYQTVQIRCKVTGFRVADGNTWWYRIASSPWNDAYYVSADAFYNNGQTSGSLIGTPYVDPQVPDC